MGPFPGSNGKIKKLYIVDCNIGM